MSEQSPAAAPITDSESLRQRNEYGMGKAATSIIALSMLAGGIYVGTEHADGISAAWQSFKEQVNAETGRDYKTSCEAEHTCAPTPSSTPTRSTSPTPKTSKSVKPTPTPQPSSPELTCVSQLPTKVKIGQKILPALPDVALTSQIPAYAHILNQRYIGGALLMSEPPAAKKAIHSLQSKQIIPLTVATDQEGGPVQRFDSLGPLPSEAEVGSGKVSIQQITNLLTKDYAALKAAGVTTIFAPVVDVAPPSGESQIGSSRLFSSDPKQVIRYTKLYTRLAEKAGLHVTLKHFPGIGSADGNTDFKSSTTPPLQQLLTKDTLPYTAMAGKPGVDVMMSNAIVPGLTHGLPASVSSDAYDLLRTGYPHSVIYTDSLGAAALRDRSITEASVQAWETGADEAVFVELDPGKTLAEQLDGIIRAGMAAVRSGKLGQDELNASVLRILHDKGLKACDVLAKVQAEQKTQPVTPEQGQQPTVTKAVVFVIENHSLQQMQRGLPQLYALGRKYGYATNYSAITHPSLPNYLSMVSGSTHGITDDGAPKVNGFTGPSVLGQALAAGKTAKVYAESMTQNCETTPNTQGYAVKHNAWPYFTDERSDCQKYDVPFTEFSKDVQKGALPTISMVVPNLYHDAHDGSLAQADEWITRQIKLLTDSEDFKTGKLAIVITGDEDDSHATPDSNNKVLTEVLQFGLHNKKVTASLNHDSLEGFLALIAGVSPLGAAKTAPSFADEFGLKVG